MAEPPPDEARRLRDAGRLEEAISAYLDYLNVYPRSWQGRFELAQTLLAVNRIDAAEKQLQAAILINGRQAALWSRMGQICLLKGDMEHAEFSLRTARDLNPADPAVRYNLGRLYEKSGREGEALQEYIVFLENAPDDARAAGVRRRVALYYESTNQPDKAIEQYRLLASTEPRRLQTRQTLADLLYRRSLYDDALAEYQVVLELDPNNAAAHFNVGFIFKMKGRLEEAEKELATADSLAPGSAKTLYHLGAARFDRGDFAGAATCFEKVIASEPEHQQAHYHYSRALAKLGRADEARRELAVHQRIMQKTRDKVSSPGSMGGD